MKKLYILVLLLLSQLINASQLENVSIQLKWKHSFQFAGYYAAIEKGFYKEKGLNVTLKEIDMSRDFIQDVVDGKSQYGVSDSSLIIRRQENEPVVLISQIFQHSPLVLISHRDSNITTPYEMSNKKIMYSLNNSGGTPFNALFLNSIGTYKNLNITEFTNYQDFIDKKVDVTSAYSTSQPYMLKKQGIDINIIDPKSYGIDFYGDNFFTTEKELQNHPKRVEKMRQATLKGWEYALSNQKEIIDIIIQKYASKSDKDLLSFEARGIYQMVIPDLTKIGTINKDKYEKVIKTYHKLGLVKKLKIDEGFFYQKKLQKVLLTNEEKSWIKEHPIVIVGGGPDWAPFDFVNKKGKYNGISNDYLNLLSKYTNLKFKVVVDKWSNNLQKMKDGKIDLLHAIYYTDKRSTYMNYTKPYFEMLDYFFIRDDLNVETIEDLNGKRVAVPREYAHEDILKKEFPKIKIITVETFSQSIDAVLENKADILFNTYASLSYVLKREGINTIIPFKSYRGHGMMRLHMSTNQNNLILAQIIDKALIAITDNEKKEIYDRWIGKNIQNTQKLINLTNKEKEWIKENHNITFAGDPDWMPFESFDEQGNYKGIVADYLKEVENRVALSFKPITVKSWRETLKIAQDENVDVISGDIDNIILAKKYEPITPYFETPIVIVTNSKHSFINDLEDIKDKKIAIINDYGYTNRLKSSYKNINFIKIPNIQEAFDKLLFENIDALLLSMPAASYLIKTRGLDSLKISGKTVVSMHPTLFVHKDKALLHSIIEKTMAGIGNSRNREILGKWQKIEFAKRVDYTLIYQLLGIFLLFILGALYWNRKLKAEVIKREESEMQIRTLMDIIPLNILVTTYGGKILLANPQTLKYHQIPKEDIKNYNILDFYSNPKEREVVLSELKKNGSVKQKIVKFKSSNSKTHDLMISLLPITYHKQNALLALGVDLTDRLKMEKELSLAKESAEKANLAKSEFLANMSHEIRTPMNSVIGFTELLSKLIKDPIQKDYLDSIHRGGQSLLAIINDILDLSKIEAGKMEITLESVDIKQLIYEMESIFSVKLIQKNLIFEVDIDESIPKYLLLDNTRVRQILFNVIGNAIKFTNNGKIKLSIKKTYIDNKNSKVNLILIIEDSGIGIKEENLEYIFDSFEQQQGQNHKYGGTGLGLAICKKLLSIMNGKISVESKFGEGSKFTIFLEKISVSSVENIIDKAKNITKELKFKPSIVLIVDDITDNRKLVHSALKPYGLTIIEAVNGKDALEKLKNIKVDLIFMDIKMPIMDGYEATQIIKNDPQLKKIPIIALTASVMGKDMEKIINYKFDGYLRKPVGIDKLVEEMARFLPHQSLEIKEDNGMQISQNGYKYLESVIETLEKKFLITWEKIKDKGDFEPIENFANELKSLIENKGIYLLEGFAKELKLSCESFDIEQIDFLMNNFPNVIKKLKKMLKNE